MGPVEALRSVFGNYADFGGRASRSEYWWWFGWLLAGGALVLLAAWLPAPLAWIVLIVAGIAGIVSFIPNLAVMARRFHDTGHSAWWMLVMFLPAIGELLLLAMLTPDSESGPNRWGRPPSGSYYADPDSWTVWSEDDEDLEEDDDEGPEDDEGPGVG